MGHPVPMGACAACEYSPVAAGAKACPKCGTRNPNPSVTDRIIGRSVLIGGLVGVLAGGVGGFFFPGEIKSSVGGAFTGFLVGGLVGLVAGLFVGATLASGAWLIGKR
jgi:hypothetical protein